MEPNIDDFIVN